jgi:hypothetical protein
MVIRTNNGTLRVISPKRKKDLPRMRHHAGRRQFVRRVYR